MSASTLKRPITFGLVAAGILLFGLNCTSENGTDPTPNPGISLTLSPTSVSVEQGGSTTVTGTLTRTGGFTGTVAFAVEGAPTGVTGTISGVTTTSATVTVDVAATTAPGVYTITVRASGSGVSDATATFTLMVLSPPEYSLSVNPDSIEVEQTTSGTTTVTIPRVNFTGAVTLSLGGAPAGVTGTFDPAAPTGTSSTLTISVDNSAAPGTYALTVDGTSSIGDRSATLTLTVGAEKLFTLAVNPDSLEIVQGDSSESVVTITRTNFTGPVTLSLENPPTGVTGTFDPESPTGDNSTLTIKVDGTVTPAVYQITVSGTTATGSASATSRAGENSTTLTLSVVEPPSYSLGVDPDSLTIEQGSDGQTSVTITRINFTDAVTLSLGGAPAGVTGVFNPTAPTGNTSTLTVSVGAAVAPGDYALTVDGTSSVGDESASLTVTVTEPPDYALSVDPDSLELEQGEAGTTTVTITRTNFDDPVDLTVEGQPAGVNFAFDPGVTTGTTSILTLTVGAAVATGIYDLTVKGSSGLGERTTPLKLSVIESASYTLAVEPDSIEVEQGSSGQTTVTISRTNFTDAVTLALGGAPAGITGTFDPAAPTGNTATLTVTVDGSVPAGVYNLTVDGTSSAGDKTTTLTVSVVEPPSYTLGVDPDSLTIERGSNEQTTVTITRTNFIEAVTLSLVSPPTGITGTFTPAAPTGTSSTLTVFVEGSVAPGDYTITLGGTSSIGDQTTALAVTVTAPDAYTLSVDPDSLDIEQGTTGMTTVTISRNSFPGDVSLSLGGAPSGMAGSFDPTSTSGTTSTLTVGVAPSVSPGVYNVTVDGTSSAGDKSTALIVNVTEPPSYALAVEPDSVEIEQGASDQIAVGITRTNFTDAVTLAISGEPAGVTAVFNPAAPTGVGSTMTLTVGAATVPGTYTINVDGSSSIGPQSTTLKLTVVEPPSYGLSVSPDSIAVERGSSGMATVTITRVNFTEAVTLALSGAPAGVTGTFDPAAPTGTSSALTINVGSGVTPGVYDLTVDGSTSGGTVSGSSAAAVEDQSVPIKLNVTVPEGFTLSASPSGATVAPTSTTGSTINIIRTGGFAGNVTLGVSGMPSGMTATLSLTSTTGSTSDLSVTLTGVMDGTYPLTITGDATGFTQQTTTFTVTVVTGGGSMVTLDFSACDAEDRPIWLAFQDGSASWMQVMGTSDVYTFMITASKGGVTWVTEGSFTVTVVYATQAELVSGLFTGCSTDPTKTVNATLAGLDSADFARTSLGSAGTFGAIDGPFQFTNVPLGNLNVVGYKSLGTDPGVNNRMFILRDQDILDMGSLPVAVDYDGPNSFDPASASITVAGAGMGELVGGTMSYATVGSCHTATLHSVLGSSFTAFGASPTEQDADDMHVLTVGAGPAAAPFDRSRSITESFHSLAGRTLTLPPAMADPVITDQGGNYKQLEAAVTLAAEVASFLSLSYINDAGDRSVSLIATAGWISGLSAVLGLDNYSAVNGWMDMWAPATTDTGSWTLAATGGAAFVDQCTAGIRTTQSRSSTF